jgi:hypothetical protein
MFGGRDAGRHKRDLGGRRYPEDFDLPRDANSTYLTGSVAFAFLDDIAEVVEPCPRVSSTRSQAKHRRRCRSLRPFLLGASQPSMDSTRPGATPSSSAPRL